MKARIKATGEIINIAENATIELDICNSGGYPVQVAPEEIELIDETNLKSDIDWEQRRYEIAKAIVACVWTQSYIEMSMEDIAKSAIEQADALIAELKKK